jgi:hypothetical protein
MQCEWNLFCSKNSKNRKENYEAKGTRDSQKIVAEGLMILLNYDLLRLF